MNPHLSRLALILVTLVFGATVLRAQQKPGTAADNRIYAQALVNELMAKHPDLIIIGIHAIAPGATDATKIATNEDKVGRKDEPDDLMVSQESKTILSPGLHGKDRFQVLLPMHDAAGNVIGALGLVFRYHDGDSDVDFLVQAKAIRDGLRKKIPTLADLFKPSG